MRIEVFVIFSKILLRLYKMIIYYKKKFVFMEILLYLNSPNISEYHEKFF